ncbi:CHAT domain-containing protein [Pantanalinema rosaneae]|uniref:CHAT domain-containing protein n=1 Tax=Pantanalinema rosaneae TaxID=1620701 RepID=UPI003D6F02E9
MPSRRRSQDKPARPLWSEKDNNMAIGLIQRWGTGYRRWLLYGLLGIFITVGLPQLPVIAQLPAIVRLDPAPSLNQQGQQLLERGNPQAALERWQAAEQLYRQSGNQEGAIGAQLNQAKAWQALGYYRRARTVLEEVTASQRQQPDSALKANALLTLGNVLRLSGEYQSSQQMLTESLRIAQQVNSSPDIQAAYLHLGNTLLAQAQVQPALAYFNQAAAIAAPLQISAQLRQLRLLQQLDRRSEVAALVPQITAQLDTLPPGQLAIYGRIELAELISQATVPINAQTLSAAQLLGTAAQQAQRLGDRRAQSYAIGRLGQLYEQTQQWQAAQRLTQEALDLARMINVPEILYQWQWQLGRILRSQANLAAATQAYTEAVNTLQFLRNDLVAIGQDVQFSFRDQVEPVYRELVDLLLQPNATQAELKQARQVIESLQLAELNNFFREACLDPTARSVDEVDPNAAVIYPVILTDRLEVILSLPGQPLRHYATALPRAAIEAGIEQMQNSLRQTSFAQERLVAAQQIYQWLIQPIAADLKQPPITTLVFVLDGALRSLPMAALHDGNQYLIEQYQIALAPSLRLLSPQRLHREQIHALVGGLSEGTNRATPLPGVRQEVDEIQRQIPAQVLLDRSFTATALTAQVQTAPFNIVHLATHGQFSSRAEETYIQTWDGQLTIDDLQRLLNQRSLTDVKPIELLVLSACQTAEGDNRATLGMAGVAVRSGALSTLATLWMVNDASTATFIAAFYKSLIQPNATKAQAIRAAQLTLIQSQEFKHPFYWAPFILVGNWL